MMRDTARLGASRPPVISAWYFSGTFLPAGSKIGACTKPVLWTTKLNVVASTPMPYFTLRLKLMEDASSKYFVGQEISPIPNPNMTASAIIWLSNTKSSEFSTEGSVCKRSREKARNPVWYSDSFAPKEQVLKGCQEAVGDVFVPRHPAFQSAPPPRMREPRTMSYTLLATMPAIAETRDGVYW